MDEATAVVGACRTPRTKNRSVGFRPGNLLCHNPPNGVTGCCRGHSAAESQGIPSFRLAKRSQPDPPVVIDEWIGCEFGNSFGNSDPSPLGDPEATLCLAVGPLGGGSAAHSFEP